MKFKSFENSDLDIIKAEFETWLATPIDDPGRGRKTRIQPIFITSTESHGGSGNPTITKFIVIYSEL